MADIIVLPKHIRAMKLLVAVVQAYELCMDRTGCTGCPYAGRKGNGSRFCRKTPTMSAISLATTDIKEYLTLMNML